MKILHVEDLESDTEMVAKAIKAAEISCEILNVQGRAEFIDALGSFCPDIILSDHSLPSFDSQEALSLLKQSGLDIPFILVTATVSEEYAVSVIKDGADDYILKDRLTRLPNAMLAAIEKHKGENERKKADLMLRLSERKYKLIFESTPLPMWMLSQDTFDIIAVNEAAVNHYGYSRTEFLKLNAVDLRPPDERIKYLSFVQSDSPKERGIHRWRHLKKDGTIIWVEIFAQDVMYDNSPARLILANDVTEKLKKEESLADQRRLQQKLVRETTISIQERERQEIGRELHDNINQLLAASKMYISLARKNQSVVDDFLQKSEDGISLAIREIRKLSHSLVAPSLEERLVNVVRRLLNDISDAGSMKIEFDDSKFNEEHINQDLGLMLYRILQEQLNNITRHAQAQNVSVTLQSNSEKVFMQITDDGIGFDPTQMKKGIGLRNIYNRAEFYDAVVELNTSPGAGCTLLLNVPLKTNYPGSLQPGIVT